MQACSMVMGSEVADSMEKGSRENGRLVVDSE